MPEAWAPEWESARLAWATRVARTSQEQRQHLAWCRQKLGAAEYPRTATDPASDPELRWPGYVGER